MDIVVAAIVAWALFDAAILGRHAAPIFGKSRHEPRFTAGRRVFAGTLRRAGRFSILLVFLHLVIAVLLMATGGWSDGVHRLWLSGVLLSVASTVLIPAGLAAAAMAHCAVLPVVRRRRRDRRTRAILLTVLIAVPLTASTVLFSATAWKPGESAVQLFGPASYGVGLSALVVFAFVAVSAALFEEILYRQYLLCRLGVWFRGFGFGRAGALTLATVITTAMFALAHGGMVEPAWIKYLQTGVLGVVLAIAQIRLGLEGAVAVHLAFNFLAPAAVLIVRTSLQV